MTKPRATINKLFSQSFILYILGPWPGINLFLQEIRCFHNADSICSSTAHWKDHPRFLFQLRSTMLIIHSCHLLVLFSEIQGPEHHHFSGLKRLLFLHVFCCQSLHGCIPQDQRIRSSKLKNNVHSSSRESLSKSHSTQTVTFLDWKCIMILGIISSWLKSVSNPVNKELWCHATIKRAINTLFLNVVNYKAI